VVIKTAKAQVAAAERRAEQAEQVRGSAECFVEVCVCRKGTDGSLSAACRAGGAGAWKCRVPCKSECL
jgi:hypothetical protein